jgi:hypothetical protein
MMAFCIRIHLTCSASCLRLGDLHRERETLLESFNHITTTWKAVGLIHVYQPCLRYQTDPDLCSWGFFLINRATARLSSD